MIYLTFRAPIITPTTRPPSPAASSSLTASLSLISLFYWALYSQRVSFQKKFPHFPAFELVFAFIFFAFIFAEGAFLAGSPPLYFTPQLIVVTPRLLLGTRYRRPVPLIRTAASIFFAFTGCWYFLYASLSRIRASTGRVVALERLTLPSFLRFIGFLVSPDISDFALYIRIMHDIFSPFDMASFLLWRDDIFALFRVSMMSCHGFYTYKIGYLSLFSWGRPHRRGLAWWCMLPPTPIRHYEEFTRISATEDIYSGLTPPLVLLYSLRRGQETLLVIWCARTYIISLSLIIYFSDWPPSSLCITYFGAKCYRLLEIMSYLSVSPCTSTRSMPKIFFIFSLLLFTIFGLIERGLDISPKASSLYFH